jgi:Tfp pilus assembly protein PilO
LTTRVVWLLTIFVAVLGYLVVYAPNERVASGDVRRAQALYQEARGDNEELEEAAAIAAARRRVDADVRYLAGRSSQSAATVDALRILDEDSRRFGISVLSISPQAAQTAPAGPEKLLEDVPVSVGIQGRFRDLVAFVSDLPRHEALIAVNGVDLQAHDRSGAPLLDGSLRLTLYRLHPQVNISDEFASSDR